MNILKINNRGKNLKVCHLSSAHSRFDTRIFFKMCTSLANNGFETSLIVADGKGFEKCNGICIYDVGQSRGRIDRIMNAPKRLYQEARRLEADLYHLHDPELIPIGLKLKWLGKKVIFDSHEDVPMQLLAKPYLSPLFLRGLSFLFAKFERLACSHFDALVAATPHIRDKFLNINARTIDINNFPILPEFKQPKLVQERIAVSYVGAITAIRGIREMVQALEYVKAEIILNIAGEFSGDDLAEEIRQLPGWSQVRELGFISQAEVTDLLSQSLAGINTLHPTINYMEGLSTKMFEYMSAGIPVIASDFPLFRELIEGNNCGICVDPLNPKAIADAIDALANNPDRAYQMGQNGQKAVLEKFNWASEEKKLLNLYEKLFSK